MVTLPGQIARLACSGFLMAMAAALLTGLGMDCSMAQSYPTRAVRILTTSPGGGSDFAARLIANELSSSLGQAVVVENRPGAGAVLVTTIAKSAPDGYTLLVTGGVLWTAPLLEAAPYDAIRDFSTITTLTSSPNILIVHPTLPAKSVAELIKLAKARPGELNFSSGPTGSGSYLAGQLFKSMAEANIVGIEYKAQPQQALDSVSGRIQLTFGQGATWAALVKSGKLRALATGGARRSTLFPDLPTIAETLPGFISESLLGLWAPARTPEAIVRRLNQDTVRALEKPEARDLLLKNGQEPVGGPPEQLADYIKSDIARLSKLVKSLGDISGGS